MSFVFYALMAVRNCVSSLVSAAADPPDTVCSSIHSYLFTVVALPSSVAEAHALHMQVQKLHVDVNVQEVEVNFCNTPQVSLRAASLCNLQAALTASRLRIFHFHIVIAII